MFAAVSHNAICKDLRSFDVWIEILNEKLKMI